MILMPASAEFAALCQSQITMMAGVVGADSTAVYLAEGWSDQAVPQLISIAVYPTPKSPQSQAPRLDRRLPAATSSGNGPVSAQFAAAADAVSSQPDPRVLSDPTYATARDAEHTTQQRLAIPLKHEGGVIGVLVSWRADRPWQQPERDQMAECAHSLTLACVLDQRGQWLSSRTSSLDRIQAQQSDRFHELLHQLRSPLTALKTFGKLLIKRLPSEDQNQLLVTNMLRESDRLQELLGYFDETLQAADDTRAAASTSAPLLLAPADESPEEPALLTAADSLAHFGGALDIHPGSVAALIEPLVRLNQPLAEAAEMKLHLVPPAEDVWLQFDPKALGEILNNLLDNALKYSSPQTEVWLQWGLSHPDQPNLGGILLGDTGPGIPALDQEHIFERHYRGRQAAGELDGSGLGLAIAADLMGEMRGQIEVYSPLSELPWALPATLPIPAATVGTAFVLWLPIAAAEA